MAGRKPYLVWKRERYLDEYCRQSDIQLEEEMRKTNEYLDRIEQCQQDSTSVLQPEEE